MSIQIHHYKISQADYKSEQRSPVLSIEEQTRAARFINDVDRIRYVCVHRFVRMKLAEELGTDASSIKFGFGEFGKPNITSPLPSSTGTLNFNLSYRGDYALLAIADSEVGIDIEQIRPIDDVDAFCSTYFHANERAIINQTTPTEQPKTIFTFWAFKEAFIKALGFGFSRDLTQFDLSSFYYSPTHELPFEKRTFFSIERVEVAEGYEGAVAYHNFQQ